MASSRACLSSLAASWSRAACFNMPLSCNRQGWYGMLSLGLIWYLKSLLALTSQIKYRARAHLSLATCSIDILFW